MASLACLTDEIKLHIVSYCFGLYPTRGNGVAVVNRLWNIMWRRMLRPILLEMIQDICREARDTGCPHVLDLLDFADAAGIGFASQY